MRRKTVLLMAAAVLTIMMLITAALVLGGRGNDGIVCQVWSKNGPDGESFEFKVNDFNSYDSLEEGPLADLDALRVRMPNGTCHYLEKDFQAPSSYSGEGGRRWVLYGPAGYGLPPSGDYVFDFLKGGEVVRSETVSYTLYATGYAQGVSVELSGRNVTARWTPPSDMSQANSYKVILSSAATYQILASLAFEDPSLVAATLPEAPLSEGETYFVSVALYYEGGFSYSQDVYFQYGDEPPKPQPE